MKKNKLLAPFLGLATVATVAAPIATSCAKSNTDENVHVKATPVTEKKSINGVVQYLLELDASDYDKNNFTVTATISEKDKSGAKAKDFAVTEVNVDGNHMAVTVKYVNEDEPFIEDTQVRLNINVKYGSKWVNSVEVKFNYLISAGNEFVYDSNEKVLIIPEATYPVGEEIKFIMSYAEAKKYADELSSSIPNDLKIYSSDNTISFEDIVVYPNDNSSEGKHIPMLQEATIIYYQWGNYFEAPPSDDDYLTFVVTFQSSSTSTSFKGTMTSYYYSF